MLPALIQALVTPCRQAKRPHLVKAVGRAPDGTKREVIIDRSKYTGAKLRELRQAGQHR